MSALLENYKRAPVTFVRGEGCELIAQSGQRFLDLIGGIAVCALGHAHPGISAAIAEQAQTLVHASNLFGHEPASTLAHELAARSGFARVFFCNSGTEANEAAIKLARKLAFRNGEPERTNIVSCTGGFHGRTLGALAATANQAYHVGFGPLPLGFSRTPFNDVEALETAIDRSTAAFIVEPVQGESGVHPATHEFLAAALRICEQRGALLIFDEIQCGMGRVGPLFAFQAYGVRPHVVTLAKALANGLPIGAMLVDEHCASGLQPGDHGSTFGGSPVPCAAALAHLRLRDELKLESRVPAAAEHFMHGLRNIAALHPTMFGEPRGAGLLIGLPLLPAHDASAVAQRFLDLGVLVSAAGDNTIRFAPPLIITDEELDRALAVTLQVAQGR